MLTNRIKKIKPSPTLALTAKAQEMAAKGDDVISLSVGEPDWNTLEVAVAAAENAIKNGMTKYAPANGLPALRSAVATDYNDSFGLSYRPEEVTVTAGGKLLCYEVLQCLCESGDEVIIPAPYWVSYPTFVEMSDGKSVFIQGPKENGYRITATILRNAITDRTKLLILNSPSNPTGEVYSKAELKEIAAVLMDHPKVFLMTDDIYNRLVFGGMKLAPHILEVEPRLKDRTICINGGSKSFSMTGWRIGWALGPKEIIQGMSKLQSQTVSCAAPFTQLAAAAAIEKGRDEEKPLLEKLEKRMHLCLKQLRNIKGIEVREPGGAFYAWVDVSHFTNKSFGDVKIRNSSVFAESFLEDQKVAVVPGIEFGMDGFLRLSFAVSEERLAEAIRRLSKFISKLV